MRSRAGNDAKPRPSHLSMTSSFCSRLGCFRVLELLPLAAPDRGPAQGAQVPVHSGESRSEAIGIALTFSLVLGTSAAVGALIPLLHQNPGKIDTPAGHAVLLGIGVVLSGVAVCAIAGKLRGATTVAVVHQERRSMTRGLVLAVLCGCGASFMNFGIAFGTPLTETANRYGARMVNAANGVWLHCWRPVRFPTRCIACTFSSCGVRIAGNAPM